MAHTAVADQTSGRLGKYRLIAVLARGGMGDVYLATADGMDGFSKLLVIKELRREQAEDDAYVSMFVDEARLAARLNHPNIVQAIEAGSDGARRFLVMEHLDGQPLSRVVRRGRKEGSPLSTELHVRVLADVLEALAYAHELTEFDGNSLGIVHRDVSPPNVFLTYEGQVKLIDFGIAKTRLGSQQTSAGILKGKIRYMAPEQATGRAVDLRTDVFSVGVMLWDVIVGHGPWEGQSELEVLKCLMTGAIPRLGDRPQDGLPSALVGVVDRAMSLTPADRYPTARAMRDDLLKCLGSPLGGDTRNELREVVSRLFADDRTRLSSIVDAQLRASSEASLQLVSLTRVRTQAYQSLSMPSLGSSMATDDSSLPASSRAACAVPIPSMSTATAPRFARLTRRAMGVLAGAALAAAATSLIVRGGRGAARHADSNALAPSTATAPQLLAAGGAGLPGTARVAIRTSPDTTKLYVDGIPVDNPYVAELVRDGGIHTVRAEAPGHATKTRTFTSAADTDLEISLDRDPIQWRGVGREPPQLPARLASSSIGISSVPPPSAPSDVRPPHVRPPRGLDKEDPYAQ